MNAPKSDFEKNLDLCKQLWEEYKYRHDKAYRNLQGELIEEIEHAP